MPAQPKISRRNFGQWCCALTAVIATSSLTGCADEQATVPDPLAKLWRSAVHDSRALHRAGEEAENRSISAAAAVRHQHAERLVEEIRRLDPEFDPDTELDTVSADSPAKAAPVAHVLNSSQVKDKLRTGHREATEHGLELSGYRAELCAAVAAACQSLAEVTVQ